MTLKEPQAPVVKEPLLVYESIQPWRYRLVSALGVLQMGFFGGLGALSSHEALKAAEISPLWTGLGAGLGVSMVLISWVMTKRNIAQLFLLPGAAQVRLGYHRVLRSGLKFEDLSLSQLIVNPNMQLKPNTHYYPFKVAGRSAFHVLDRGGKFPDQAAARFIFGQPIAAPV